MATSVQSKPIVIIGDPKFSNFSKGIAPHPLEGFGNIRNVDVISNPGSIRLNYLSTRQSSGVVTTQPNWIVEDPVSANLYAVDVTNQVFQSTDHGISWTLIGAGNNAAGQNGTGAGFGLAIWKGYLICVGLHMDAYGPINGSPAWTKNFASDSFDTTNTPAFYPTFASVDDSLYIGNGRFVHRLQELTTFVPGTGATFSYMQKVITLATNYIINCIQDLGSNLMLGTLYVNGFMKADIFPYMRSTLTLGLPIQIVENGVQQMITVGNRIYAMCGMKGKMFETDTVTSQQIFQIPNYLCNLDGGMTMTLYPGAIMSMKGKIHFGIGSAAGISLPFSNCGVWSYNPSTRALQIENIISTGNDGTNSNLSIGALCPVTSDAYAIGWKDGQAAAAGIDLTATTARYSDSNYIKVGYIDSPLVKVGESLDNMTAPQLEVNLTKPLVTGQGVRIQYRKDLTSNFVTLATADFATYGGFQTINLSAAVMTNLVYLQIRALLTTASVSILSPELQSVLLVNPT